MEDHHHHLLQPLIPTTLFQTHSSNLHKLFISSNLTIFLRLVFIVFIGLISIWANQEASKGFTVTIINNSGDSIAGKRFSLFYESNDEATRTILKASKIVENIIYFNKTHPRKQINHMILQLASPTLAHTVMVNPGKSSDEFILNLCPSIIQSRNFREATSLAVLRGMAHIWLWGGPPEIINGMVEFIVNTAVVDSGGCGLPESDISHKIKDRIVTVAELLNYCERESVGFIGRLNREMKDGWDYRTVDDVLGKTSQHLCGLCVHFFNLLIGSYCWSTWLWTSMGQVHVHEL